MYSVWLGSKQSYEPVLQMLRAHNEGQILDLMASSPAAMKLHMNSMKMYEDGEEDYRIGEPLLQVVGDIAVVSVKGALVTDYAWYNSFYGLVSYDEIRDAVSMAADDQSVKKILLLVESPGGHATGISEISNYIKSVDRNIKPVYGHTNGHAHSAGYWLLSSTRSVSAAEMASTGSIGVIMTLVDYSKMYEDIGIEFKYLRSGKYKALGQSGEALSEEAEAMYMDIVMQLHGFFERHVMESRGTLATSKRTEWSEGKTFFSKDSKSLGLIDEIITFDGKMSKLYDSAKVFRLSSENIEELAMKFKLSEGQLQKLASGVPLDKLGLSAEELADAKEHLKSLEGGSEASDDLPLAEDQGETETVAEDDTTVDGETEAEVKPEAKDPEAIIALTTRAVSAEAKVAELEKALAAEQAKVTSCEEKITAAAALETKLVECVAEAAGRFQVALGQTKSDFTNLSTKETISQYEAGRDKVFATFSGDAKAKGTVNNRAEDANLQSTHQIIKRKK